jgi:hypothetical protein
MNFKQIVNKAMRDQGELLIEFIKVTDGNKRVVKFATSADVGYTLSEPQVITAPTLKKIEKITHNRIFSQQLTFKGCLLTFPEDISGEDTAISSKTIKHAPNGAPFQWRRLYVNQILTIKYNGDIIFDVQDKIFDFDIYDAGELITTVSKADIDNKLAAKQKIDNDRLRDKTINKQFDREVDKIAKTLKPSDCAVNIGYLNGIPSRHEIKNVSPAEAARAMKYYAIMRKHDILQKLDPEHHRMTSTTTGVRHNDEHTKCSCGFGYSADMSD